MALGSVTHVAAMDSVDDELQGVSSASAREEGGGGRREKRDANQLCLKLPGEGSTTPERRSTPMRADVEVELPHGLTPPPSPGSTVSSPFTRVSSPRDIEMSTAELRHAVKDVEAWLGAHISSQTDTDTDTDSDTNLDSEMMQRREQLLLGRSPRRRSRRRDCQQRRQESPESATRKPVEEQVSAATLPTVPEHLYDRETLVSALAAQLVKQSECRRVAEQQVQLLQYKVEQQARELKAQRAAYAQGGLEQELQSCKAEVQRLLSKDRLQRLECKFDATDLATVIIEHTV